MRLICVLLMVVAAGILDARDVQLTSVSVPESRAARIRAQVEGAFEHVQARTGLRDDGAMQLVLVGASNRFAEIAQRDGVSMNAESVLGYAIPRQRRLVLNLSAIDDRGLEPLGVLRHEVAHLVMGSQLGAARPLWFEEGMANHVESMALNALIEGSHFELFPPGIDSLDDLSVALRDGRAGMAYPQSRKVVQHLVSRWGEPALFALLEGLRDPQADFAAEFTRATGAQLADLEAGWLKQLDEESSGRVVAWVGANWVWMLFGAGGLILLLGVIIRRQRGARQIEAWDEQDRLYPSDPAWSYTEPDEGFSAEDDRRS